MQRARFSVYSIVVVVNKSSWLAGSEQKMRLGQPGSLVYYNIIISVAAHSRIILWAKEARVKCQKPRPAAVQAAAALIIIMILLPQE